MVHAVVHTMVHTGGSLLVIAGRDSTDSWEVD